MPGVVAGPYGLDNRADSTLIRGTTAAQYLDGLRRTFGFSTYNYRIDPFFMERVEVLRGPASVLYGQAPVGGIINAVSKLPQTQEGGELTVEYGNYDYKEVKFDTTGPASADGKWSYRLTGLARDADTQVDYVEDDRYAIQPALTYRPTSDTSITLMGLLQKDHSGSTAQFFHRIGTLDPNVNGRRIPRERFRRAWRLHRQERSFGNIDHRARVQPVCETAARVALLGRRHQFRLPVRRPFRNAGSISGSEPGTFSPGSQHQRH